MLKRVIDWSVRNIFLVSLATVASIGFGIFALQRTPLEALPDLSDVR